MSTVQVEQLTFQLELAQRRLRTRLTGLTDDEYMWEPVGGCWSVRSRGRALGTQPEGAGDWLFDWGEDGSAPAPFTTIAWRLMHLTDCIGSYHDHLWGRGRVDHWLAATPVAAEGVALWDHHATAFAAALADEDDERLALPVRIPWWPAETSRWRVVVNVIAEATHHGAEIGVLRDLHLRRDLSTG